MNRLKDMLLFAAGGLMGSSVAYYFLDKYFNKKLDEEVSQYRVMLEKLVEKTEADQNSIEKVPTNMESGAKEIEKDANTIVYYNKYNGSSFKPDVKIEAMSNETGIEIISAMQFGEIEGYDNDTLYFEDGLVKDNDDEIIINPETFLGEEAIKLLEEGAAANLGESAMYIRNSDLEIDYEIIFKEGNSSW